MKLILGTMTFGQQVFEEADNMLEYFWQGGYREVDTAYVYNEGASEKILGECLRRKGNNDFIIATKVNPRVTGKLDYDAVMSQFKTSLMRLQVSSVDVLYLHFPDPDTPVEEALKACQTLYKDGKIRELGLSNFSAEMVDRICQICMEKHWIKPTVYEGVYNGVSRKAEQDLFEMIQKWDMRFYAYNPLAGGMLTGKYSSFQEKPSEGRFTFRPNYQNRYWKPSFFQGVELIKKACDINILPLAEASLRWLAYHSYMVAERGDGIILGVSKMQQLQDNMLAIKNGPLPASVVNAFDQAWEICLQDAPEYFRVVEK